MRELDAVHMETSVADEMESFPIAPRGATIDEHAPRMNFPYFKKIDVWAENIEGHLAAMQRVGWTLEDIDWSGASKLSPDLERALCQIITFLAEGEYLSLYATSKFIPRISPYYGEAVQFLSSSVGEESNHIGALRRIALAGSGFQQVSASTQYALRSILLLEDYYKVTLLLRVFGEGITIEILSFLESICKEPVASDIFRRIGADEEKHYRFGVDSIRYKLSRAPRIQEKLVEAVENMAAFLYVASATEASVQKSLAVLAGGGEDTESVERGMIQLKEMYSGIERRKQNALKASGFSQDVITKLIDEFNLAKSGLC